MLMVQSEPGGPFHTEPLFHSPSTLFLLSLWSTSTDCPKMQNNISCWVCCLSALSEDINHQPHCLKMWLCLYLPDRTKTWSWFVLLSQVVFRAKRGISYMGDLVLDDVSFLHCSPPLPSDQPCTPEQYTCANGHCIPQDNLCDFINHCGDNSDEDPYICSEASSNVWPMTPCRRLIFR